MYLKNRDWNDRESIIATMSKQEDPSKALLSVSSPFDSESNEDLYRRVESVLQFVGKKAFLSCVRQNVEKRSPDTSRNVDKR